MTEAFVHAQTVVPSSTRREAPSSPTSAVCLSLWLPPIGSLLLCRGER